MKEANIQSQYWQAMPIILYEWCYGSRLLFLVIVQSKIERHNFKKRSSNGSVGSYHLTHKSHWMLQPYGWNGKKPDEDFKRIQNTSICN